MSVLPATGAAISMGRTQKAYNNVAAGTGAAATAGSTAVRLSASLGASYNNGPWPENSTKPAGSAPIKLSVNFGGRTTPYTY